MRSTTVLLPLLALPLLAACGGKDGGGDTGPKPELTVLVNAPTPAGTYHSNEGIPYEVIARLDGEPTDIQAASWSLDDGAQTASGATGTFDPVAAGDHTVHVEVHVAGQTGYRDVNFTVSPPEGDADTDADTDADADVMYMGTVDANIDYHGSYGDFGSPCPGTLRFSVAPSGTMTGDGTCRADTYDFPFTLEGTVSGGSVSGNLVMTSNGTEVRTPFAGHGNVGSALTATYDTTHTDAGESVRVYGSWTAEPQ